MVSSLQNVAKAGGESALLQEAQHMLPQKDVMLSTAQEKLRDAREEHKRMEAEARKWRTTYEFERKEMEENRKRIDELRQAPQEIVRLQRELQSLLHMREAERAHSEQANDVKLQEDAFHQQTLDSVTRERDNLMAQLRERDRITQRLREEVENRGASIESEVRARAEKLMESERALFKDREFQLRHEVELWTKRFSELQELNVQLKEQHQREIDDLKAKERQRQENMLVTMGKFEKERMAELMKSVEEQEKTLRQKQEALDSERLNYEAERRQRVEEIEMLRKQLQAQPHPAVLSPQNISNPSTTNGSFSQTRGSVSSPSATIVPVSASEPSVSAGPSANLLREVQQQKLTNTEIVSVASSGSNPNGQLAPKSPQSREVHTPPNIANRVPKAPSLARYEKGDDTQSEVTVKQDRENTERSSPSSIPDEIKQSEFLEADLRESQSKGVNSDLSSAPQILAAAPAQKAVSPQRAIAPPLRVTPVVVANSGTPRNFSEESRSTQQQAGPEGQVSAQSSRHQPKVAAPTTAVENSSEDFEVDDDEEFVINEPSASGHSAQNLQQTSASSFEIDGSSDA
jgi:hypothetical protein